MNLEASRRRAANGPLDVLFAVINLGTGGMERRCLLLSHALVERGWRVGIVTLKETTDQVAPVDPRVELFTVKLSTRSPASWTSLYRLLRTLRPRIFQGFGTLAGFPVAVVARLAGVPIVINALVIGTGHYPRWFEVVGRTSFAFADQAVANSSGVCREYVTHWRFPAGKVTVIPNPVDVRAWPFRDETLRRAARAELGLSDDRVVVGLVARLIEQKGHERLLDAFASAAATHPEVTLVLVGEGPLQAALEARATSLNLNARVQFLGRRHDVPRLLQAFDLFCLPSLFEGMPNVVLEAMAAGLPVIATDVAGVAELVVPGQTGWITPVGDRPALAAALGDALRDAHRLKAMGERGRRRVEEEFDLPLIIDRYVALYERLAAAGA